MKKLFFLVAGFILFTALNIAHYQAVSESFVRFHIIAESNSPYDQLVKLRLRDYILSVFSDGLSASESKAQTLAYLSQNKQKIKEAADNYLREIGYNTKTHITLQKEYCPPKKYSGFSLPYGKYDSFKITIGEGKGKNFFCVLFPPVCVSSEMTGEVNEILENKKIIYKFKLFDKEF